MQVRINLAPRTLLGRFLLLACLAAGVVRPGGADTPAAGDGADLGRAALAGDLARVRALLDRGVGPDAPASRHGHTALMFAAERGHGEVAALLLERGADPAARESFFGITPLSAALDGGHLSLARVLLERGGPDAFDALLAAVEHGDIELARAALTSGRVTPLELKAARRRAAASASPALKALLDAATATRPRTAPVELPPQQLAAYAGRYRGGAAGDTTIAVEDGRLRVRGPDPLDFLLHPVGDHRFETAAGDVALELGGRGGLIEWAALNHEGELMELSLVTAEPAPMRRATGPGTADALRTEPRPWPQFRGPGASGVADGQGVPLRWDCATGDNVRFTTAIPGLALSSPIVWGDRIFVTTAVGAAGDVSFRTGLYGDGTSVGDQSEHSFRLYALDATSGAIVWEREIHRAAPTVRRHLKSSLANATPATDGQRVIALFGAVGVLAAYDFQGRALWTRDVGVLDCNDPQAGTAEWGHASSPVIHDGLVFVQGDRRRDSFLAAYRVATGEEAWRVPRDETSTWSTPSLLPAATGDELITNGRLIRAYDPRDGSLLWTLGPNSEVVVATPVVGGAVAFLTAGYPPVRPIYAVRGGRRGDLTLPAGATTSDAVAWSHTRGGTYIPTPILYRDHLYLVNNNGILACHRAADGERVYQTRLGEGGASFAASPVAADGRLYFFSETGDAYVLRAGAEYELLTTGSAGGTVMATPAASGGLFVVRTLDRVIGIAAP
jgi:outer membrane protein assembly factor BamB